jgi:hypothetical protein
MLNIPLDIYLFRIANQYSIPRAGSPFSILDEIGAATQDVQAFIQTIVCRVYTSIIINGHTIEGGWFAMYIYDCVSRVLTLRLDMDCNFIITKIVF